MFHYFISFLLWNKSVKHGDLTNTKMIIHRCSGGGKLAALGLINEDLNSTWKRDTHLSGSWNKGHQGHPVHVIVVLTWWELHILCCFQARILLVTLSDLELFIFLLLSARYRLHRHGSLSLNWCRFFFSELADLNLVCLYVFE